jgi:hypothetical protein
MRLRRLQYAIRFRLGCGRLSRGTGDKAERLTLLWRDKQLQYAWLRSLQGRHADFWQVTGEALDFALDTLQLHGPGCATS